MKRRKFLIALGVVPPLVLGACKKDPNWPSTPTIIKGKVIDENNMPVESWDFLFIGIEKKGIYGVDTFSEQKLTDVNGLYSFSVVIPQNTDKIDFYPLGFRFDDKLNRKNSNVDIFFERDGKYIRYNSPAPNPSPIPGEINIINFQIRKI